MLCPVRIVMSLLPTRLASLKRLVIVGLDALPAARILAIPRTRKVANRMGMRQNQNL